MGMPRKKNKNPPVMSHEFVIQNHADIVSCTAIVVILGLVFETTAKISRLFIFLQYGIKQEEEKTEDGDIIEKFPVNFERGWLDAFTVVFQAMIIIVVHAVIQEYLIDKVSKKLHLSKTKTSKFNESGQLAIWSVVSACWAAYRVHRNGLIPDISKIWEEYPHNSLYWEDKLFLTVQLAYWLHMFPEIYLQKIRKEEIRHRIQYYSLYFGFILCAYFLHFWRFATVVLAFHYSVECIFHLARMFYFAEKTEQAQIGFNSWRVLFPLIRFIILSLTIVVFVFGLGKIDQQGFDPASGNYNTSLIRNLSMGVMCMLQLWLMWLYIQLQFKHKRNQQQVQQKKKNVGAKPKNTKKNQKKQADAEVDDNSVSNGKLKRS